ncbi:MAG: DUF2283 domain-containing protein [Thermomicrobiales bacterium]
MPEFDHTDSSVHPLRRMRGHRGETERHIMKSSTLTYDPAVKALYIELSDNDIAETIELSESVCVDLDADGEPVGFEILHAAPSLVASHSSLPDAAALKDLMDPTAA